MTSSRYICRIKQKLKCLINAFGKITFSIENVAVNVGDGVVNTAVKDPITNFASANFCNGVESVFKIVEQISNTVS